MLKKLFYVLTSLCLLFAIFNCSTYANDTPNEVQISEYDQLVAEKKELKSTRANSYSNEYEKLYLERASLDKKILKEYGYTDEEIRILKNYKGEPIENYPALSRASATVSAKVRAYKGECSPEKMKIYVDWSWSKIPLLCGPGITDRVAIRWKGVDVNGHALEVAHVSSSATISYFHNNKKVNERKVTSTLKDVYCAAETPVLMDNGHGTALKGTQQITLEKTGRYKIGEVGIQFVYGHATLTGGISFGYPSSGGISLSPSHKETYVSKRVTSAGTVK